MSVISSVALLLHNPLDLDRNIETLLHSGTKHFGRNALNINWKKGKTEACLMYLGPHASTHYAKSLHEGTPTVKRPTEASADFLVVVRQYKNLGGILAADGNFVPEVNIRTTQAVAALTAITPKILASRELDAPRKVRFVFAYVVSRFLYLCTREGATSRRQLMALESVYLRAQRRATGTTFTQEKSVNPSNVELLSATHLPSLQCLLRRRRLGLFARLVRTDVRSLVALINDRPAGIWLPWTRRLFSDLLMLKNTDVRLRHLPDPVDNMRPWLSLVRDLSEVWKLILKQHITFDSSTDGGTRTTSAPKGELQVECPECAVQRRRSLFATEKATGMHRPMVHCWKTPCREHIGKDACCKVFSTRTQALVHLGRPKAVWLSLQMVTTRNSHLRT